MGETTATPTHTRTPTPTGTSTATATPTTGGTSLADLQEDIFDVRCAIPGCHTRVSAPFSGNLSLEPEDTFDELVGVEPDNPAARVTGLLRVDPGSPENSFVLIKLNDPDPALGSRMPLTGDPLTPEEIDRIRVWVTEGAEP